MAKKVDINRVSRAAMVAKAIENGLKKCEIKEKPTMANFRCELCAMSEICVAHYSLPCMGHNRGISVYYVSIEKF